MTVSVVKQNSNMNCLKQRLFNMAMYKMRIFGVIYFFKQQNNT